MYYDPTQFDSIDCIAHAPHYDRKTISKKLKITLNQAMTAPLPHELLNGLHGFSTKCFSRLQKKKKLQT